MTAFERVELRLMDTRVYIESSVTLFIFLCLCLFAINSELHFTFFIDLHPFVEFPVKSF